MRAREPDRTGYVVSGEVNLAYEVFGAGGSGVLLMPTWTIIHSRSWKMQVPYLARRHRVISYDGPGNGGSDRPSAAAAYSQSAQVGHALRVLHATATERAIIVSLSKAANWALQLAADHPDRVLGSVFIGPGTLLTPWQPERAAPREAFDQRLSRSDGWWKYNRYYWLHSFEDFARFFFSQVFTESHSTKPVDDCVDWALETTPQVLLTERQHGYPDQGTLLAWCQRVRCPVLVIQGVSDAISPFERGRALADACRGTLVALEGSGHAPHLRDPVRVNLLLDDFIRSAASADRLAARGASRATPKGASQ